MTTTIFMNTLYPFNKTQCTDKEAKILIDQGRKAFEVAKTETKYGAKARQAILENEAEPNQHLVSISAWHYGQGCQKFGEAINKFEEAKTFSLSQKYKNYVDLKIQQCLENARICNLQQQQTNNEKSL
jgi:hypothetical protein